LEKKSYVLPFEWSDESKQVELKVLVTCGLDVDVEDGRRGIGGEEVPGIVESVGVQREEM
ncbi:hypothetical protein HAX54_005532, partial [Datura stramonium]|nr:hypothetical protein [Datura stramonium]